MNTRTPGSAMWPLLPTCGLLSLVALLTIASVAGAEDPLELSRGPLTIESSGERFHFEVEIAKTPAERAHGLMFRENLSDDHGMLFDFGRPQEVAMWMRNTFISLDILFIRSNGRISRIVRDAQPLSDRVMESGDPVRAVLELRGGLTAELGIKPGDRIIHPLFEGR